MSEGRSPWGEEYCKMGGREKMKPKRNPLASPPLADLSPIPSSGIPPFCHLSALEGLAHRPNEFIYWHRLTTKRDKRRKSGENGRKLFKIGTQSAFEELNEGGKGN
jgi:hypothetical protein